MKRLKLYTSAFALFAAILCTASVKSIAATAALATTTDQTTTATGSQSSVAPAQYGNTTVAPATASDKFANTNNGASYNAGGNPNGGVGQGNGNGNQDHYPINNGILFLLAAGIVIGIKVVADQSKKLKTTEA